jgi:NADH dehydrogenase (ubiquinone) 1 alpha subcomplex subunit 9
LIAQDRHTLYPPGSWCFEFGRNFKIRDVNVDGAQAIARACKEAGVPRLIHVSGMRAAPDAISEYSRTKAEGEERVRTEFPDAVIVRPSTIFGTQDRLVNGIGRSL